VTRSLGEKTDGFTTNSVNKNVGEFAEKLESRNFRKKIE